jgi:hypothetical protein
MLLYDPAVLLLGRYSGETEAYMYKKFIGEYSGQLYLKQPPRRAILTAHQQ